MLISTFPILYKLIKGRESIEKPPKLLYIPGLIFIILNVLNLSFVLLLTIVDCQQLPNHIYTLIVADIYVFYILQTYFLILQAFIRLYFVFSKTIYQLSIRTVKIYKFMFIFIPIFAVIAIGIYVVAPTEVFAFVMTPLLLILISFIISNLILFVRKLIHVYKSVDSDAQLISTITKLTILKFS